MTAARLAYRRIKDSQTWHFCANCSSWPTKGYTQIESAGTPAGGHACTECQAKARAGRCDSISRPPVGKRVAVLDVRLPFRFKTFLQARPFEADLVPPHLTELRRDASTGAEWRRLLDDHGVDSVWFQVYRQNPRQPVDHAVRHYLKRVDADPNSTAPPPEEPSQRTGRSGLVVVTTYFPKGDEARDEPDLARKTADFLERLGRIPEVGRRVREHGATWAYRTVSARGEEYEDLDTIKKVFVPPRHSSSCGVTLDGGGGGGCDLALPATDPAIPLPPPPPPAPPPPPPPPPATVPGAPQTASCVPGDTRMDLTWTPPATDGGSPLTGYQVRVLELRPFFLGGTWWAPIYTFTFPATITSTTIIELNNGSSYLFRISAVNAIGIGPSADTSESPVAGPGTDPGPPLNVVAAPVRVSLGGGLNVTWDPPSTPRASEITGYEVQLTPGGLSRVFPAVPTDVTFVPPDVTFGVAYTATVIAIHPAGNGPGATSNAATPVGLPSAPLNLVATPILTSGDVKLTWDPPASDGGGPLFDYMVYTSPGSTFVRVPGFTPVAIVTGLTSGASYTFAVSAHTAYGEGPRCDPSNPVIATGVPTPPSTVTAVAGNGSAQVSWNVPANDGGSPLTEYRVIASPSGIVVSVPPGTTTAVVAPLANGTSFSFTVIALNLVGPSMPGGPSNAVTPLAPLGSPDAPTGVTAVPGDGRAVIDWNIPAFDGGSPVTVYFITAAPGGLTLMVAPSTQATLPGLANGTSYTFTVVARNAVGDSVPSAPSNSVTPVGPPAPPSTVTAVAGNGSAQVSWNVPASDGGSPLTEYRVIASPSGIVVSVPPGTTTAVVAPLANGTSFSFTVIALNLVGSSMPGGPSNAVTPQGPPDAPTGATATPGDTSALVNWNVPAFDGGSAVTAYVVTAAPGGLSVTVAPGTSASFLGLSNGTSYAFTVVARNAVGDSVPSAPSNSVTPVGLPAPPSAVTAVAGIGSAQVSWNVPASDGGSPLTEYRVIASPSGLVVSVPPGTTTAAVAPLANGTSFTFTVIALNLVGPSVSGGPSNAVMPQGPPDAPTGVTATPGDTSALVTWNVPAFDGGSPVTAYVVTAAPAGVSLTVAPGTQVSFPGLTNGTSVTFTVVARNAVGDSLPSAPSSAVTPSRVNLRAQITDSPDPVVTDANVTYAVVVTNLEPTAVTNVQLVITRSPDVAGVSVTPSQGSCTGVDVITCNLGTLAGSASATVNVVIRPITPTLTLPASATVSTNVLDADPSDNSATTTTRVNAAPNTTYVAVRDASITPSTTTLSAAGDTVQWNFFGPNVHSATDASGLGLFDTGLVAAVAFSSKVFVAAGTYPYADSGSALTAVVEVPLQLGAGGPNIQVAWASVAAPAGYVYDVQMLTPGAPAYVDWQAGVTMRQKNYNHTATGPGLYKFRARLRQIASGATSGWSPEGAITV